MPAADWKQWAVNKTVWMEEETEMAFKRHMKQKWKDDLDVLALRTCRIGTQCTRSRSRLLRKEGR
jgi:hypothetical protein